jgi:hypothetical protein
MAQWFRIGVLKSAGILFSLALVTSGSHAADVRPPMLDSPDLAYEIPRSNTSPGMALVADVTGDGRADITLPGGNEGRYVSLLAGRADGTFERHREYPTVHPATFVVSGDFDSDGQDDLAVLHRAENAVALFFSRGGVLVPGPLFGTGQGPVGAAAADLSGDQHLDLVTVNQAGTISILLGDGAGLFAPPFHITAGSAPQSVAVGDLNQDQVPDLVVSNSGSSSVSVFPGTGGAQFGARADFLTGNNPVNVIVSDFDADGFADIGVPCANSSLVTLLYGGGDGNFSRRSDIPVLSSPVSLSAGDLNRDGHVDLAVVHSSTRTGLTLMGDGAAFRRHEEFIGGGASITNAIRDLNGDGYPELTALYGIIRVFRNRGDGSFGPLRVFAAGQQARSVVTADLDLDGHLDLVVANREGRSISMLPGRGDGSFGRVDAPTVDDPFSLSLGRLNSDDIPDLVLTSLRSRVVYVSFGDGSGNFLPGLELQSAGENWPLIAEVADLNDDGRVDIVVLYPLTKYVSVFLSRGDGTFEARRDFEVLGGPRDIGFGDLDGDGKLDAVTANLGPSSISILPGLGDGSFGPRTDIEGLDEPASIAVGDLDGDDLPDIFLSHRGNPFANYRFLNSGTGTFRLEPGPPSFFEDAVIEDMDGDGISDLVGLAWWSQVMVVPGGPVVAAPDWGYGTGHDAVSIVTGDFNEDGRPDVATANPNHKSVTILLNTSPPPAVNPPPPPLALLGPNWPNPFRSTTTFRYSIPVAGQVRVTVHDAAGRLVARIFDGDQSSGEHALTWDAGTGPGDRFGAGVYFLRLQAGDDLLARRIVFLGAK